MKKEQWLALGIFIFGFAEFFFGAFVVGTLWDWFVVPQFNVISLEYKYVLGMLILIAILFSQRQYQERKQEELLYASVYSFFYIFWALVLGWIIHFL